MTEQTKAEMETLFSITEDNRNTIHVFSDSAVWQRKLERAGAVITRELKGGGKEYTIEYRQLSIRKAGKRELSEEQKVASKERMKKMLEARKTKNE